MNSSDDDQLAICQETLRRLEEEIELLRDASLTFGELADRLNKQVQTLRAQLRVNNQLNPDEPDPLR